MREQIPDHTPAPTEPLPQPEPLRALRPWKVLPKHIRKRLRGRTVMAVVTGDNGDGVRVATVTHRAGNGEPTTDTFTLESGR